MRNIVLRVNHGELRSIAAQIDSYCDIQDREMRLANRAVTTMLTQDWRGPDAREFGRQWMGVNDRDSVALRFRDALRNYANALRASADLYQRIQADVVNQAGVLMRIAGR